MLSVLIPIYNFDIRPFVADLAEQAAALEVDCEIICFDDASDASFKELHKHLADNALVRYIESDENLGRSKVRNAMEREARYDNLLFLDCDGRVVRDDYLAQYAQIHAYDVVYGGRVYPKDAPTDNALLFHWYCGKQKEEVDVASAKATAIQVIHDQQFYGAQGSVPTDQNGRICERSMGMKTPSSRWS